MTSKITTIATIVLLILSAGCSVQRQPAPERTQFLLNLSPDYKADIVRLSHPIRLRSFRAQAPFSGTALVYRSGEVTFEKDHYNRFFIAPDQQLDNALPHWLKPDDTTEQKTEDKMLMLQPSLEALYADFQTPSEPNAYARLRFVLTRRDHSTGRDKIIMDETFEAKADLAPNPTAEEVVKAMSQAARKCLLQSTVQLSRKTAEI